MRCFYAKAAFQGFAKGLFKGTSLLIVFGTLRDSKNLFMRPSHAFPFKALRKANIFLNRPYRKKVPSKRPFLYRDFFAIEQMRNAYAPILF